MKVLLLDNYDSFTYNLSHLIEKVHGVAPDVVRNDKIKLSEISSYDKIILSPGPGLPKDAGMMPMIIKEYANTKSILGVCLGMQAIAESFGAKLNNLETVYHGIETPITITSEDSIYKNIPTSFKVGRYHSWVVDNDSLPEEITVTSVDDKKNIMSIKHNQLDVRGVQYHPESILSEHGEQLISNWLKA